MAVVCHAGIILVQAAQRDTAKVLKSLIILQLFVEWPIGAEGPNITYVENPAEMTIYVAYTYLQLEPIGLLFLVFFAFVLFIQVPKISSCNAKETVSVRTN